MGQPVKDKPAKSKHSEPEFAVSRFYNSIFGHTRNWPRAYRCLAPSALERFGPERGLQSFADYWDNKLSFLEEIVKPRHEEYPYTHRTCFSLDRVEEKWLGSDSAVFSVELIENHVARDRLTIVQTKQLVRHAGQWLLTSGELEGSLDDIIHVKGPQTGRVS